MPTASRKDPSRKIRAPRGTALSCKSWLTEAGDGAASAEAPGAATIEMSSSASSRFSADE